MNVLDAWLEQLARDLELDRDVLDQATLRGPVLDLTRDVAHGVARPAAPLSAYLVGLAAGRGGGDADAVRRALTTASGSVAAWVRDHPPTESD